jgi:hypothetical protein
MYNVELTKGSNMKRFLISKFKRPSKEYTPQRLTASLRCRHITPKIRGRFNRPSVIINWGISNLGINENFNGIIINHPDAIRTASNKLKTFTKISENAELSRYLPLYTTYRNKLPTEFSDKEKWVCRTILTGSSGKGIIIAESANELVDAPLYVKYFPKKYELRVHVINNKVVLLQQKRKLTESSRVERGISSTNKYIRNLDNGYIYSTDICENILLNDYFLNEVRNFSIALLSHIGLDFGAIDIIISKRFDWKFLEINTAPGLQGNSINVYSTEINNMMDNIMNSFEREEYE